MKILSFLVIAIFTIITISPITAQQSLFFMFGYGVEQYQNTDAINIAVKDFNDYNISQGLIIEKELETPGLFRGSIIGMKGRVERMNFSFSINTAQFKSTAKANDSLYLYDYFKKIKIGNVGINMNYSFNLINAEKFRTGPGISINIEKFRMYCRDNIAYGTTAYEKPVDKFMISGSVLWSISIGGEKFNFDINPYFTLPFWKVDASLFNSEELNFGHSTSYSTEQMTINPVRYGVSITFNVNLED
jgi:hypothetical protein